MPLINLIHEQRQALRANVEKAELHLQDCWHRLWSVQEHGEPFGFRAKERSTKPLLSKQKLISLKADPAGHSSQRDSIQLFEPAASHATGCSDEHPTMGQSDEPLLAPCAGRCLANSDEVFASGNNRTRIH